MNRSDRIPLAAELTRCEPSKPGQASFRCARALASVPTGTPMADYSTEPRGCAVTCVWYVDINSLRREVQQQRPAAKPWPGSQS